MENKNIVIGGIAIVALVVAGIGLYRPVQVSVNVPDINVPPSTVLGGNSGTEHTNVERFPGGIFTGGDKNTVSTSTGITGALLCSSYELDVALPNLSVNLTLPSSTTVLNNCFTGTNPPIGKTVYLYNTSSSVNALTLAISDSSSTLLSLILASSSANAGYVASSSINGQSWGRLTIIRTTSSSQPWINFFLEAFRRNNTTN